MKIRTQLIISTVIFAAALAIISASVVSTNQQVDRLSLQEEHAKKIELKVGELSYLSNDYLLYHEGQQIDRWESKYSSISNDISNLTVSRPEQQVLIDNIKASHQRLKIVFGDIVSGIENEPENLQNTADPDFIEVSWSRMGVQTQGIVFDASRLSQMLREEADQARQQNDLLILALIGAFIAFLFADYLLIFRRALKSVSNLREGTRVIGSGNLDYSLEEKKDDEIGELAHAFNLMTANLKTVTASKADLEREVVERKRAEEALHQAYGRLQTFFDHRIGGIGIVIANARGEILQANDYYLSILGCTREELLSGQVDWRKMTPPEWLPADEHALAQLRERGISDTYEKEYVRQDGTRVPVLITDAMMPGDSGDILAFVFDVTERKRAEEELERLASFPRLSPNPVVEVDLGGRVHFLNPAAQELFPNLLGMGRDHPWLAHWELVARMFRENKTSTYVRDVSVGDKWHQQVMNYIADAQRIRIYSLDITERKRAEDALRLTQASIDGASEMVAWFRADGSVYYINDATCRTLGYSREELLKMNAMDFSPGFTKEQYEDHWREVRQRKSFTLQPMHRRKDGSTYIAEVLVNHVVYGGQEFIFAYGRDITERKQMENALKDSEERYKLLFENANDGIVLHKVTSQGLPGDIIEANEVISRMLGYTKDEMTRLKPMALQAEGPEEVGRELPKVLSHEKNILFERQLIAKDGRIIPVEFHTSFLDLQGSASAISIIRDITERKQAEDALRESEDRFRTIAEAVPVLVSITDAADSRVLFTNKAHNEAFGYRKEEVLGLKGPDYFCDQADRVKLLEAVRERGFVENLSVKVKRKDGSAFWILSSIRPISYNGKPAVIAASIDNTGLKQAEEQRHLLAQELADRAAELQAVLNAAPVAVWIAHDPECKQITGNAYADQILQAPQGGNVSRSALPGEAAVSYKVLRNGVELQPEEMPAQVATVTGKPVIGDELELSFPDGRAVYLIESAMPLFDAEGKVRGAVIAGSDVTRLKLAEEALKRSRDELEQRVRERTAELSNAKEEVESVNKKLQVEIQAQKKAEEDLIEAKAVAEAATRAKSEFLANMSHEIRTPMNSILGFTELLLDEPLSPVQKDNLETIRTSGDALLTIINDILDFSKIESDKLVLEDQPFNLRSCVEESIDLVSVKASGKGLNLAYTIDKGVPDTIIGDPGRVRQVLANLLSNAVKFTDVGEVIISVSSQQLDGTNEVHFAVQDTGIGIPQGSMHQLFQPFSQMESSTTRLYGGTGLGLAISKKLVELMGGRIWAESEVGKGSTFHFTIKASSDQVEPKPAPVSPQLIGKHVLIIEDNKTNRRILSKQVYNWGMVPIAAKSGREALSWVLRGDKYDIAILDMDLQDMDALELEGKIRKYNKTLPLVLLTSYGKRVPPDHAYLTKPIKPSLLHKVLTDILPGIDVLHRADTLPKEPAWNQANASGVDRPIHNSPLRILLAEDNISNQKVAQHMLKKLGHKADTVTNGIEALQALERQHYDVVLMDVKMPEMDGLEATRIIRQRWPDNGPKIIAITAYALEGDRKKFIEAGMDDYITKPVEINDLRAVLESNLSRKNTTERLR